MKIHRVTAKIVDIFLNLNTYPTGYEESCWLRLQKKGTNWIQTNGIKIPSWKFKQITEELK